ncbi:MAG: acyloxyacyl hydrolase [Bacteroidota bacterium]|nr:acyloxyacyl hydrolase [Bacteroidota bacterium]
MSANYHKGFLIPEYQNFNYISNDYIKSFNLSISKKTRGENDWEQLFKYPEYGMSIFYSTLGNDEIHGREIALYPYFQVNLISKNNFNFYKQIGFGLNYVSRKFNLQDNYLNISVGSHVNFHFNYKLGINYKLFEKVKLNTGLSFDHFSNANMQEPNLGVNSLTFYSGLTYGIGQATEIKKRELSPHIKENYFEVYYNFGGKRTRALASDFYLSSSLSLQGSRKVYRVFHLGLGLDLFYDQSVQTEMKVANSGKYKAIYDFQSGIHFSQAIVYDRLILVIQEGIYMGLREKVNNHLFYNRGIIKYRIYDHLIVSLAMKSHLHILDYPEIGLGYKF